MVPKWRSIDVDATWWRRIDVHTTSYYVMYLMDIDLYLRITWDWSVSLNAIRYSQQSILICNT